jgi:hypothetical protein
MDPEHARPAVARLNAAIDSAAQAIVRSAAGVVPSRAMVRATATATNAFAAEVDGALTDFVAQSVPALSATGAGADAAVAATLAALGQVIRTVPGAVTLAAGAEVAVASGADGTTVSASLDPRLDTALRQTISATVHAIRPMLPLTHATVRSVAAAVRSVVDATEVAVDRILRATVDLAAAVVDAAVVDVTSATLQAARSMAQSTVTVLHGTVAAVDATLDAASDVNLTAQVDASLSVSTH